MRPFRKISLLPLCILLFFLHETAGLVTIEPLGCYKDEAEPNRMLKESLPPDSQQTPLRCASFCHMKNFSISGVEFRTYCFCGTEADVKADSKTDSTQCGIKCPGNDEMCGGTWYISVFRYINGTANPNITRDEPAPTTTTTPRPIQELEARDQFSKIFYAYKKKSPLMTMKGSELPFVLKFKPILQRMVHSDDSQGTVTLYQTFWMEWKDLSLTWNKTEHQGVAVLRPSLDAIWHPDLIVADSFEQENVFKNGDTYATLKNDGTVRVERMQKVTTQCEFDAGRFPYDEHVCPLAIQSPEMDSGQLRLESSEPDLERFHPSPAWTLRSFKKEKDEVVNQGAWSAWEAKFRLRVRRQSGVFAASVTLPIFLATTLLILGLFSPFNTKGERREKVSLFVLFGVFIAVYMLPLRLDSAFSSSKSTVLDTFAIAELLLGFVATVIGVGLLYRHHRGILLSHPVPDWLLRITFFTKQARKLREDDIENTGWELVLPRLSLDGDRKAAGTSVGAGKTDSLQEASNNWLLRQCLESVAGIRSSLLKREMARAEEILWCRVFVRLDLQLLLIFFIVNVILTLVIFHC